MQSDDWGYPFATGFPEIDAAGMVEVDLLMTSSYGIALPQMMENAGRALATLARDRFLGGQASGRSVVVLAGAGGNGGGALVAARRLAGWGAQVQVVLAQEKSAMAPVPAHQMATLCKMGLRPELSPRGKPELILDGLIGYSLIGPPRGRAQGLMDWANASGAPILSLDVPSGFDARAGRSSGSIVRAEATMTLALPKRGLADTTLRPSVGDLYLADISVPPGLYERLSTPLQVPPFSRAEILRLPN